MVVILKYPIPKDLSIFDLNLKEWQKSKLKRLCVEHHGECFGIELLLDLYLNIHVVEGNLAISQDRCCQSLHHVCSRFSIPGHLKLMSIDNIPFNISVEFKISKHGDFLSNKIHHNCAMSKISNIPSNGCYLR